MARRRKVGAHISLEFLLFSFQLVSVKKKLLSTLKIISYLTIVVLFSQKVLISLNQNRSNDFLPTYSVSQFQIQVERDELPNENQRNTFLPRSRYLRNFDPLTLVLNSFFHVLALLLESPNLSMTFFHVKRHSSLHHEIAVIIFTPIF